MLRFCRHLLLSSLLNRSAVFFHTFYGVCAPLSLFSHGCFASCGGSYSYRYRFSSWVSFIFAVLSYALSFLCSTACYSFCCTAVCRAIHCGWMGLVAFVRGCVKRLVAGSWVARSVRICVLLSYVTVAFLDPSTFVLRLRPFPLYVVDCVPADSVLHPFVIFSRSLIFCPRCCLYCLVSIFSWIGVSAFFVCPFIFYFRFRPGFLLLPFASRAYHSVCCFSCFAEFRPRLLSS